MKSKVAAAFGFALALSGILALVSCEKPKAPQQAQQAGGTTPAQTEERVEKNPDRNAYFGETHPHQLVGGCLGHRQPHHRAR